jgi:8-oxo-dGTP pyrophosphatase MutT (NUDIX family)
MGDLVDAPAGVLSLTSVQQALAWPDFDAHWAQYQMAPRPRTQYRPPAVPGAPRQGGVLLLLYPWAGRLSLVLTRRTSTVENHQGQISLPGGSQEPGETLAETALRETGEELGIAVARDTLLGRLASLYIPPSDFEIHPFVAYCPARPALKPAPAEVAELLEVPLNLLLDPAVHRDEEWTLRGLQVQVPFYLIEGHKVWGATAMVLSEMEQRLRLAIG